MFVQTKTRYMNTSSGFEITVDKQDDTPTAKYEPSVKLTYNRETISVNGSRRLSKLIEDLQAIVAKHPEL